MDIQNQNELPEKGELILATVLEIQAHGVYVDLEEFFNLKGYLHRSEISTGWVRRDTIGGASNGCVPHFERRRVPGSFNH